MAKLQIGAALQEQYFVIIRNVHQIAKILFRFLNDGLQRLWSDGSSP